MRFLCIVCMLFALSMVSCNKGDSDSNSGQGDTDKTTGKQRRDTNHTEHNGDTSRGRKFDFSGSVEQFLQAIKDENEKRRLRAKTVELTGVIWNSGLALKNPYFLIVSSPNEFENGSRESVVVYMPEAEEQRVLRLARGQTVKVQGKYDGATGLTEGNLIEVGPETVVETTIKRIQDEHPSLNHKTQEATKRRKRNLDEGPSLNDETQEATKKRKAFRESHKHTELRLPGKIVRVEMKLHFAVIDIESPTEDASLIVRLDVAFLSKEFENRIAKLQKGELITVQGLYWPNGPDGVGMSVKLLK